ncbi:MAG: TadE/TadG family type IV pilus assembly protein [Terriglobia bacterium]|nr:TadE/TadG family type IV pilus assembly protein [Terriglobia bacterium]
MTNVINNHSRNDCTAHSARPRGCVPAPRAGMRHDAGQALVELALVFPLFILLLLGAAEFGRLAYAAIEISNAARAGAAYGAQTNITASDFGNIELAATQDAPNVSGVTATAMNFCTCSSGAATPDCTTALTPCPSPARIQEYVQVNTTATVDPLFHYPGLPSTFTLTGQAIMRVEQQ